MRCSAGSSLGGTGGECFGVVGNGFLSVILVERMVVSPEWRAALLIGFLGAFTTFSTFSLETLHLMEQGAYVRALLNTIFSVVLCVAAAWMGLLAARQL
jgi:CrcB protein